MRSDLFNFTIPEDLIAQTPSDKRDASKLMVLRRATGAIEHHVFSELPSLLNPGDLLVANNTRVNPCRLFGVRDRTRGNVELFLLRMLAPGEYEAITRSKGRLGDKERLVFPKVGGVILLERDFGGPGHWRVRFESPHAATMIAQTAVMPLPPYIKREEKDSRAALDRDRYQTVYAQADGAVAAPTAGLHFTPAVFDALKKRRIERAFVTLHVGPGTFRPLKADTLEEHEMHAEEYEVNAEAANAVAMARARKSRVIAVGTTSCRTLETLADEKGLIKPARGQTKLFIYPPYQFRATDALLTNFHLPRSTLIFLVAAFAGEELTRKAYLTAIEQRYRFFSYGDSMLVL